MKLRNKKTGVIKNFALVATNDSVNDVTLAQVNDDWEDYEEPKEYWFMDYGGRIKAMNDANDEEDVARKEIGNHFDTREEAEKAVEKLKAWKRLKDKGVEIVNYDCYGGTNTKGEFSGEVRITIDVPHEVDKCLLKLLFGGEE